VGLAARSPRLLITNYDIRIAKRNTTIRAAYAGGDDVWGCPTTEVDHTPCVERSWAGQKLGSRIEA